MRVVRLRFDQPLDPGAWDRPLFSNDPNARALGGWEVQALPEELPAEGTLLWVDTPLEETAYIARRLLGPGGCPWDQAQTHESLKRHLLEEAYEVIEAIDSGSEEALREELGDLLLQPVMHGEMAAFGSEAVARAINDKLIRRHPHVFGDLQAADADEVLRNWDRIKAEEKGGAPRSVLAGVPTAMPSLLRAFEVSKRAARQGFEWPNVEAVFDKVQEEIAEVHEAIANGDAAHTQAEIGDLLFAVVNLARWSGVEPEEALRSMVSRFAARFMAMEASAGRPLAELSAQEWDDLWEEAKRTERKA